MKRFRPLVFSRQFDVRDPVQVPNVIVVTALTCSGPPGKLLVTLPVTVPVPKFNVLPGARAVNQASNVCSRGAMEQIDSTGVSSDDITIERCRELLGEGADRMSDGGVEPINRHAETVASAVIDVFLRDGSAVH
jgi:hypothetical protein